MIKLCQSHKKKSSVLLLFLIIKKIKIPPPRVKGTLKTGSGRYKEQLECIWFLKHNKNLSVFQSSARSQPNEIYQSAL